MTTALIAIPPVMGGGGQLPMSIGERSQLTIYLGQGWGRVIPYLPWLGWNYIGAKAKVTSLGTDTHISSCVFTSSSDE